MTAQENDEQKPEQQSLLQSAGSESLDEQVVYDSVGSLLSGIDDIDTDDNDIDIDIERIELKPLSIWEIVCILSSAFFLRLHLDHSLSHHLASGMRTHPNRAS